MKNSTLLLTAFIAIGVSGQLMGMESFLVKFVPTEIKRFGPYGDYRNVPAHFEHVKTFPTDPSPDLKPLTADLQAAVDQNTRVKKYFTKGETIYCAKISHLPQLESDSPKMFKVDIEQKN